MNFEEAGQAVDRELQRLRKYFEQKVRPETKKEAADLLRKAAERLTRLADSMEKGEGSKQ